MSKKILCISYSPIENDARVLRQLEVLAKFGDVTTVGYGQKPALAKRHIQIPDGKASLPQTISGVLKLALHTFKSVELKAPAELETIARLSAEKGNFDLVIANDARALPIAFYLADTNPVVVDLHEWAREENTTSLIWKILVAPYMDYLCKKYLAKTTESTTVNQSIADLYLNEYGVLPKVVRNSRQFENLVPAPVSEDGTIRLVHSGIAVPERNIESLIDAAKTLGDKYQLHLYLISSAGDKYVLQLKARAGGATNIHFHNPVKPAELPAELNKYDLGVYLMPIKSSNTELMLPNKFFDYIQARLGIFFSPTPEISKLTEEYKLGPKIASYKQSDLVAALRRETVESVERYKKNAHIAASVLTSRTDVATLENILDEILN